MRQPCTPYRWVAAAAMMALLAGCSGDGSDEPPGPDTPATVQQSPDITDITEDYFSNPSYLGKTVTVTGDVTRVITPASFVLTGEEYDDDSILVLSAQHLDVREGEQVTVTGEVQRFEYTAYEGGYGLDDDDGYIEFAGEEFLVAARPGGPASPAPSG